MTADLQKADVWKRIAAWLLDIMLVCVMAVGIGALLSWALDYDGKMQQFETGYYSYIEQYQLQDVDIYDPADAAEQERIEQADRAMLADQELCGLKVQLQNMMLLVLTFSLFITIILLEVVVPLLLKNGQTVGKKVFGLGLVRVDGVRIGTFQLFVRGVLGKFTIETMVPVYAIALGIFGAMGTAGVILLGGLIIGQVICVAVTKYNCALHDQMSGTVVVDLSSQRIFSSSRELIEYTKRVHAEQAARKEY